MPNLDCAVITPVAKHSSVEWKAGALAPKWLDDVFPSLTRWLNVVGTSIPAVISQQLPETIVASPSTPLPHPVGR